MKFIFYYFYKLDQWCLKNITKSSFASVDMSALKNFKIPIPSLEKQQKIIAILDKFDTLVNDLSTGLPAELEARRKQYEYYRNLLVSFNNFIQKRKFGNISLKSLKKIIINICMKCLNFLSI